MRNLKKLLALVLAVVMSLALVTVASAKSASDFADGKDITYTEAVDVMTAIGVFEGVGNNTFQPNTVVTREQAAKIATYMLMGKTKADRLTTTVAPYADVAADRWSAGAIAYCTNEGILAGVGGGKFDPAGQLTGLQFAKIMLVALGYDPAVEKLTGKDWAINTAKLAITASLDDELEEIALSAAMTRQQAAQMGFNTLKADLVWYENRTEVNVGGTNIVVGGDRQPVTQKVATDYANRADNRVQQFIEEYQEDLDYTASEPDDFGRPGHAWDYDGDDVGTYGDDAVATFTAKTSAADIAKALSGYSVYEGTTKTDFVKINNSTTFSDDDTLKAADKSTDILYANSADDSELKFTKVSSDKEDTLAKLLAAQTANGKLVEIYANNDKQLTRIVAITYTAGKIDKVATSGTKTTYTIKGLNGASGTTESPYVDTDENADDTAVLNGTFAKGDIVTFVKATTSNKVYVYPTTNITGKQTNYTTEDAGTAAIKITVSGSTYDVAAVTGAHAFKTNSNDDVVIYFDQYGYAIESTSPDASENFAYIVAAYGTLDKSIDDAVASIQVRAVLEDGTVGVYKVALDEVKSGGDKGDYNIKGLGTKVYDADGSEDADDVNNVAEGLVSDPGTKSGIYTYTLSGDTITLTDEVELITDDDNLAADTYYTLENDAQIKKGDNTSDHTGGSNTYTALLTGKTTFIMYNEDDKNTTVYNGNTALPSGGQILADAAIVIKSTSAQSGTSQTGNAVVVFDSATLGSGTTDNVVYIDSAKFVEGMKDDNTKTFTYTAIDANGNDVTLVAEDTQLSKSGLYVYSEDGTVKDGDAKVVSDDTDNTVKNVIYIPSSKLEVVEDTLLKVDTAYYNIVPETKIVYVDDSLTEVDGNAGYVVLAKDGTSASKDVDIIFITAAATT